MDVDLVLTKLGKYGKFQIQVYLLLALVSIPWCWDLLAIIFVAFVPGHQCRLPEGWEANTSIPLIEKDGKLEPDGCHMFVNESRQFSNDTEYCPDGWEFVGPYGRETVTAEFQLFCDESYKVPLISSVVMASFAIGGLMWSHLADRYGRKKVLITALLVQFVLNMSTAFAPNYLSFVALKAGVGFMVPGSGITSFIMTAEVLPVELRSFAGLAGFFIWSLATMAIAALAYLLPNWRHLQIALAIPSILIAVPFYWILPESLHFLVTAGRHDEAKEIVKRASIMNNVPMPELDFPEKGMEMKDGEDRRATSPDVKTNSGTVLDVLKNPTLRIQTLVQMITWFTNAMIFYGLTILSADIGGGSPFINFTLVALVEFPAAFVGTFVISKFGRRIPLIIFFLITGSALLVDINLPPDGPAWIVVLVTSIGKYGVASAFLVVFLYGGELYPTVCRNSGLALCTTAARLSSIIAPFIVLEFGKDNKKLPPIIFACLALVSAVSVILLPETLGRPLMQRMEEVPPFTGIPPCRPPTEKLRERANTIQAGDVETEKPQTKF